MTNATFALLYAWAGLWCALIAWRLPDAPRNWLARALGSVVIGIMWPTSLPLHFYFDIPKRRETQS